MNRDDLIRYVGKETANTDYHDGQLRPAAGTHNIQVLRANRSRPERADGYGWTYNHAPMLAHWKGKFYLEYLSTPRSEHVPPSQTFLIISMDGMNWRRPMVVFPVYPVPNGIYRNPSGHELPDNSFAVMHQRMGFYEAPNGRLLVLAFYGICPHYQVFPNNGKGIGRVVREIYEDGGFGPIFFIRYNRHAGWNETNTGFPFYRKSEDRGFVDACEALLENKLVTMQWWEEDRSEDGFYSVTGERAPSTYRLKDGRVVAVFKSSRGAISSDEGATWSPVEDVSSLIMSGGKVWGQMTSDGRYALAYNPTPSGEYRWPLALVTSDDGMKFDDMLAINGEVSPRRYDGLLKDYGLGYVRGIEAGNREPTPDEMWLTYSMNKEDLWISRVPVPISGKVDSEVDDTFEGNEPGLYVPGWNVHSPLWAQVILVDHRDGSGRCVKLADRDPYEYAKASRVFPESLMATVEFRVQAAQDRHGRLYMEPSDRRGIAPIRMRMDEEGRLAILKEGDWVELQEYVLGEWITIRIELDVVRQEAVVSTGAVVRMKIKFVSPVSSMERMVFRTGDVRKEPNLESPVNSRDVPGADEPVDEAVYYINGFKTYGHLRK